MAEAQVGYVLAALAELDARGLAAVEPLVAAQERWNAAIQRRMKGTVWTEGGCRSWYIDRNGLNTSLWPDFSFRFARELRRFDPGEYRLLPAAARASGPVLPPNLAV